MRWIFGNFRDIGGYRTVDGRTTRWRVCFRSGALDALSDAELSEVRAFGIRSVVDLRIDEERGRVPRWIADDRVEVLHLPSPNPAAASLRLGVYDPAALYLDALDARRRDFGPMLTLLSARSRLPVVVACSGGKDRTGMMIALVLALMGVPEDTIVDDYALSDEFRTRDPAGYVSALERVTAAGLDPEVLRTRPETMRRFLREVTARHGSIEAFASAVASDDVVDRVRQHLLE